MNYVDVTTFYVNDKVPDIMVTDANTKIKAVIKSVLANFHILSTQTWPLLKINHKRQVYHKVIALL